MKTYIIRSVLTISVIALIVFVTHRVVTHMQTRSEATASVPMQEQQGADAWIQGFSYHQTRSGASKWVVTADQAKVFDEKHTAELRKVKVQLFDQDFEKEQMHIVSDEGVMNTVNNDFDLVSRDQKTIMTFEAGYQLFSDRLTWKEDARQIQTEDSVVIRADGLVITGTGLIGDIQKKEFHLLQNVRAEVSSP